MLLLLFISSNFSRITCIPTLLGDIALLIVGFLTGAFDEDDAPVSSCAVSASSTLGVLLSLGMLMVAPNACGGCFPLTLLAFGGFVVVDGSSSNSLFSCVGGLGFCLLNADVLFPVGLLFSTNLLDVSIGALSSSGATSTSIVDFSSFIFFWRFTFWTCLFINLRVGFILDGFSSSSSSGMMASVSFDAISPPIDPPFAVPPAVATALMMGLDDLRNFFKTLLLLEDGSSSSSIPADAVAPTASYAPLFAI